MCHLPLGNAHLKTQCSKFIILVTCQNSFNYYFTNTSICDKAEAFGRGITSGNGVDLLKIMREKQLAGSTGELVYTDTVASLVRQYHLDFALILHHSLSWQ